MGDGLQQSGLSRVAQAKSALTTPGAEVALRLSVLTLDKIHADITRNKKRQGFPRLLAQGDQSQAWAGCVITCDSATCTHRKILHLP